MTFTTTQTSLRTIKPDDPKFMLQEGMVVAPRAGFEISEDCSPYFKTIIVKAIQMGWLKPVATVKDNELFWEELSK